VQLAALARVENPTEQPNAALARHCPALLTLAAQAMATPESLHVVLLLLAVRSLNRVSLLVHDSGARVDELSMITVADLIESVMHAANFAIPSLDALASVPELATTVTIILACPFRFDRFASGESNAKQLETYFQLKVSHGSVATGSTRAMQLLLVSCLGDFAPELQRAIAAIPPSRNSSEGGGRPTRPPSPSAQQSPFCSWLTAPSMRCRRRVEAAPQARRRCRRAQPGMHAALSAAWAAAAGMDPAAAWAAAA